MKLLNLLAISILAYSTKASQSDLSIMGCESCSCNDGNCQRRESNCIFEKLT